MLGKKICLIGIIAAQLIVPGSMIFQKENILKKGKEYKFLTAPVDPYDVFRGRYVALEMKNNIFKYEGKEKFYSGQIVYALLGKDSDGYAVVENVTLKEPKNKDYIKSRVRYIRNKKKIVLNFNLDRFYMNEHKAKKAEKLYRKFTRKNKDKKQAFVLVKILNGKAVIEDLYLDNRPVDSYFN